MHQLTIYHLFKSGVGNLTRVAGRKQTLQSTAGHNNFPPTIPFPLLLLNPGNLWNFNQINSCAVRFLISNSSWGFNTRSCNKGRFIKYNTTRRAIQLLQCGKGDAGRMILLGGPDPARFQLATNLVVFQPFAHGTTQNFKFWCAHDYPEAHYCQQTVY